MEPLDHLKSKVWVHEVKTLTQTTNMHAAGEVLDKHFVTDNEYRKKLQHIWRGRQSAEQHVKGISQKLSEINHSPEIEARLLRLYFDGPHNLWHHYRLPSIAISTPLGQPLQKWECKNSDLDSANAPHITIDQNEFDLTFFFKSITGFMSSIEAYSLHLSYSRVLDIADSNVNKSHRFYCDQSFMMAASEIESMVLASMKMLEQCYNQMPNKLLGVSKIEYIKAAWNQASFQNKVIHRSFASEAEKIIITRSFPELSEFDPNPIPEIFPDLFIKIFSARKKTAGRGRPKVNIDDALRKKAAGYTQAQIAKSQGVSQQAVSLSLKKLGQA
ncbi:hypothetical protein MMIC_P0009 [Mariprofundus micogutta]|uniref:Uncharacterized protein n=1 Tax=Mariprofundus micogutta TaxID=1921010 RepID=A0A1L8CJL2_9PROT|nr:hypothetical protein [Mariprofundus micogutta]GAV19081.1 hypothetical protein MMIC_P0009 [Mariprofundus micogutta]